MSTTTIRTARAGDVDRIVTLLKEIHAAHLAWDGVRWTTREPPHAAYAAWIASLIAGDAPGVAMVAEVDAAVVGYAIAEVEAESARHWSPRAVYLHDVFVSPTHRRRGLADALVRGILAWSDAHHPGTQLRLITAAANEPARAFFARFGFRASALEMIRESVDGPAPQ